MMLRPDEAGRLPYFAAAVSRSQRILLVAGALVVAIVAFVIAQPGDDDDEGQSAGNAPAQTETRTTTGDGETEPTEAEPAPPPKPEVTRISLRGGSAVGGPKDIEVTRGDTVRIVVTADAPDEIHLHGYDIEKEVAPGQPARFRFKANAEGAFEIESHVAEDAGRDPLVARLVVQPS
jgi:FtsP/CotA-like multicopper oxidase with cupredoxin domain